MSGQGVARFSPQQESDNCNLIVNYVPPSMLEHEFKALFQPHGTIVHYKLLIDGKTGRSLGYGFVKYSTEAEASAAIAAKNGYQIGNKRLKVALSRPSSDEIKNCKLYVTNLPSHYNEGLVQQMFQVHGTVIECRVLADPISGTSKNTAFVQMSTRAEAQSAIDTLNGEMMEGTGKALYVKFSQDHAKKRRLQEAGMVNLAAGAGLYPPYSQARQKPYNQVQVQQQHRYVPVNQAQPNMGMGMGIVGPTVYMPGAQPVPVYQNQMPNPQYAAAAYFAQQQQQQR